MTKIHALRQEGYQLLHDGLIALAQVEANGIRIDTLRLEKTKKELKDKIRELQQEMEPDETWRLWQKQFGSKANITSGKQFATIFYDKLGNKVTDLTEHGQPSTDEEALQKFNNPFATKWVRLVKYKNALNTFLKGIEKEVVDGRLHPFFNLHTARSMRSSSSFPNFQNFPVRDKEISEIIRRHFIASSGCVLVENDFKSVEVCVSAAMHKDKNFISYITTPGKDMHRDMAAQIYFLEPEQVSKDARYGAKNKFVFPQFYGDFYISCARALWDWIERGKLTGPDGKSLYRHLRRNGIYELGECDPELAPREGTFEKHLQEVEDDFWNHRFREYGQWKKDWYQAYLKKGYFDLLTGFRIYGSFNRNAVINYPVQGQAFHCLLWSLIRVNYLINKYRMRSKVVGQIHDSLIGDVKEKELRDYLEIVEQVTTVDLLKAWKWINVPLTVEYEIAPPGRSWFEKKETKFIKGRFYHPEHPEKFTTDPLRFLRMLKNLGDNKVA